MEKLIHKTECLSQANVMSWSIFIFLCSLNVVLVMGNQYIRQSACPKP